MNFQDYRQLTTAWAALRCSSSHRLGSYSEHERGPIRESYGRMAKKLGNFKVWYIAEDEVPPGQVQLAVAWVGTLFYKDHDIERDTFIEVCRTENGKTRKIVRLARCLNRNKIKRGNIGLQYDCLRTLGLTIRPGDDTVDVYSVHWLRGIIPYLSGHPNPLIRYQFLLSSFLAVAGIGLGAIGIMI